MLKGQLSLRQDKHSQLLIIWGGKKALIEIFFLKNSNKPRGAEVCHVKFFEHIKAHPHSVSILESKLCLLWFHAGIKHITHIIAKIKNQAGRS